MTYKVGCLKGGEFGKKHTISMVLFVYNIRIYEEACIMKNRRFVSMVFVFVMLMAIGFTGTVSAENVNEVEHEDHFVTDGVTRMGCASCGVLAVIICTGEQVYSHSDTHKTGFLGIGGETCRRVWCQSTLIEQCPFCLDIINVEFGHYCTIAHSICDNETMCVAKGNI